MKHSYKLILHVFSLIIISGLLLISPLRVFAQESVPLKPNSIAEQWVLSQTALGEIANLENQFPNEEDRVLSATFLENLLENPSIDITRYGVRIRNAIFIDPLDLEFIQVGYDLQLENCQFGGYVDFSDSWFVGDLSFDGSTFKSRVDFSNIRVDKTFHNSAVSYEDSSSFTYAVIGRNFVANDVQFTNAEKEATFNSMKVGGNVFLRRAVFAGSVNFILANIGVNFEANDVQFTSAEKKASFSSMKVGNSILLTKASFAGAVDFAYADVGNSFVGDDVQFTSKEQTASFNSMRVGKNVFLRRAVFAGSVDFILANIGFNFDANDVQFTSDEKKADFSSMKAGNAILLTKASFAGAVDFAYVDAENSFVGDDVQFTNKEQAVSFNSIRVGESIFLRRAVFAGSVNFILANIGVNFDASDVQFTSAEKKADFNSVKAGNSILLTKASFAGAVDFAYADVGNSFVGDDVQFTSKEQTASFNSMRVGKNVFLRRAVFAGSVDFRYTVSRYFDASNAKFLNSENMPVFDNMIVEGEVWFSGTVFKNGTEFDDATFLDLSLIGDEEDNTVSSISLNRTVIKRELSLKSLQTHDLHIRSLTVHGPAVIRDTNIVNSADFENSEFADLSIENVVWPDIPESINLRGMQYQNIKITRDREDDAWNELISLINSSKYNAQSYTILESYFLQQGYPERADKVYVTYKRRERAEALSWNSLDWWWSLFLDVFVSYGRSPGRALIWSILIIILGRFVFGKPENMVLVSERDEVYNPLWYSLDLFIPFVDLGFDKEWSPKPEHKWAVAYAKIHMLTGWVLIPIGLLAITGVIK